jgi:NTE family protein
MAMLRFGLITWALLLGGCASYGTISNQPLGQANDAPSYDIGSIADTQRSGEVTLILAFSGGGTRAAALAYGVLLELRDTPVVIDGRQRRLLDEVDLVTSVSGGSFTAAYFGLFGDATFKNFEHDFLRRDVAGELTYALFNPAFWFSRRGRGELAVEFAEATVFKGATFADLQRRGGPTIVINATDLGGGVRFSFLQEYFDLLCSDLSSFPVARAVTASSAVPVLLTPVAVENYPGCRPDAFDWLDQMQQRVAESPDLLQVVEGLRSYADKQRRRYIHLVDGGVSDNLGLRAIYEFIEVGGGPQAVLQRMGRQPAPHLAVIAVNASTIPAATMEDSPRAPTLEQTVNAVTDVQIHRYNAATLEQMRAAMRRWSAQLSTPERPVEPYFAQVDFTGIAEPKRRIFFNQIPTRFSLDHEQVDALIDAGRELLRGNAEFQRFVADLGR